MTAFQFREWWRYRRAAKGRHGVHSPFVYQFVEECLHPGLPKHVRQQLRLFHATAHEYGQAKTLYCCFKFLGPKAIHCLWPAGGVSLIAAVVAYADVKLAIGNMAEAADCILLGAVDAERMEQAFSDNAERMKEGLVFMVGDIHTSPHKARQWLRLREDERVNLSIDLWHIGLLFYRADFKERQHFVLKYPA